MWDFFTYVPLFSLPILIVTVTTITLISRNIGKLHKSELDQLATQLKLKEAELEMTKNSLQHQIVILAASQVGIAIDRGLRMGVPEITREIFVTMTEKTGDKTNNNTYCVPPPIAWKNSTLLIKRMAFPSARSSFDCCRCCRALSRS